MSQLKRNPLFYLSVFLVGVISLQFYSVVSADWSSPPGPPPASNISQPLDTSSAVQLRRGCLIVSADGTLDGCAGVNPGHAIDIQVNGSQPASLTFDAGSSWTSLRYDETSPNYFIVRNPYGPLFANTLGIRLPNISTAAAPKVAGNVVFDTGSNSLQVYNGTSWGSVSGAGISGGEAGYLPLWQSATTLTKSSLFQAADGSIGIGMTNPKAALQVAGTIAVQGVPQDPESSAIILGSGLSDVATDFEICDYVGYPSCQADNFDSQNTVPNYTVSPIVNYKACPDDRNGTFNDIGKSYVPGTTNVVSIQRTVTCRNPDEPLYKVSNVGGTLTFSNNAGQAIMTLNQKGDVSLNGTFVNGKWVRNNSGDPISYGNNSVGSPIPSDGSNGISCNIFGSWARFFARVYNGRLQFRVIMVLGSGVAPPRDRDSGWVNDRVNGMSSVYTGSAFSGVSSISGASLDANHPGIMNDLVGYWGEQVCGANF